MLDKAKIKHNVLNAKQHEREANIIVEAGRPGAVTIATNMAGRGTDMSSVTLRLKSKPWITPASGTCRSQRDWQGHKPYSAGGLHIVATGAESRRIDNQLRGRSGRQGDPGVSRFYLSLEDPLMRLFASDRIKT